MDKLSKNFVVKNAKIFDKIFFILERNLGVESKKNGLEKQKSRLYFSKT